MLVIFVTVIEEQNFHYLAIAHISMGHILF